MIRARNTLAAIGYAALAWVASGYMTPLLAQTASGMEGRTNLPMLPAFEMPNDGSGWIDFAPNENGQIVIPVTLNEIPVSALVDTGVPQMVISKSFAGKHHLPLTSWGRTNDFAGFTDNYVTPNISLTVGSLHTTTPGTVAVTDLENLNQRGIGDFDVVIGLSVLGDVGWEIDQDHHRFRLFRSGSLTIEHPIPLRLANSRLFTNTTINNHNVSQVVVDTGSDEQVSLTNIFAKSIDFKGQTDLAAAGIGGIAVQPYGKLTDFHIGERSVPVAYATVSDWFKPEGGKVMIGMGVLQNYNMVADPPAGKMMLTPRSIPLPAFPKSTSGVQGSYQDGRITIVHIMKNSPAASISLKAGDQICSINGKPMSESMVNNHWGRAAPGTRYELGLCDGSTRIMTLQSFY